MLPLRVLLLIALISAPSIAAAQDDGTPGIPPPPPPAAGGSPETEAAASETPEAPESTTESDSASPAPEASPATAAQPEAAPTPAAPAAEPEAPATEPEPVASASARSDPPRRTSRWGAAAPSPSGETGVLRVAAAEASPPGLIRVGLGLELFSIDGFFAEGDENSRVAGILSLSGSPIDFLELWLNIRAVSNSNNTTTPNLLQSQGDLQFGAKGFYPVADLASVGVDAQVTLLSGIGESGYDFGASEVRLRGLLTTDLSKAADGIPLRAHLNAGIIIDNSDELIAEGQELTEAERFALGVGEFDRVALGAAIEVPVPWVTPYLEYTVEFPIDYLATPGVVVTGRGLRAAQTGGAPVASNAVARPAVQRIIPQRLTPGVRVRPLEGFTVDVAVEIGLTPDQALGVPAVPDYNVVTLFTYAADPFATRGGGGPSGPPVAVPVIVPEARAAAAPAGRVGGLVIDKATGEPLADAIVSVGEGLPVATAADGRFAALGLEPGPVSLTVRKSGYVAGTAQISVVEDQPADVEVVLEPEIKIGTIQGAVVDASGAPVSGATVLITPAGGTETKTVTTGADGRFEMKADAGGQRITVSADGFLRTGRAVEVEAGATTPQVALQLTPRGEVGAKVDGDRVVLPEPLVYAKGEIVANADVRRGLDLVTDLLLADATLKVEIGGHTDSRGNEVDNQDVSKKRAEAAQAYLLEHGVPASQVGAAGYGASRPIAPNLTRAGRERNRRIDFSVR